MSRPLTTSWVVGTCCWLALVGGIASAQANAGAGFVASRGGRISGMDDDGVDIGRTTGLVVTPEGRVVAVQMIDAVLRVYSERDGFERQVGRKGGGPGEFERPIAAGMLADTLWVYDSALRRVTYFSQTFRPIRTASVSDLVAAALGRESRGAGEGAVIGILRGGAVLVQRPVAPLSAPSAWPADATAELVHLRAAGPALVVDTLRLVSGMTLGYGQGRQMRTNDRLATLDFVAVTQDGNSYVTVGIDSTSGSSWHAVVQVFDATGKRRYLQGISCATRPLSKEEVELEVRTVSAGFSTIPGGGAEAIASYRRAIESHKAVPCVRRALIGDDGAVWLQISRVPTEKWIRLSPDGTTTSEVAFRDQANRRIVRVSASRLWVVELDADEVASLHWYTLSPR
jgi:hypothetical protein